MIIAPRRQPPSQSWPLATCDACERGVRHMQGPFVMIEVQAYLFGKDGRSAARGTTHGIRGRNRRHGVRRVREESREEMNELEQQHRCKGKPSVPPPEAPGWIRSCTCREGVACMREGFGSSAPRHHPQGRCSTRAEDTMKKRAGDAETPARWGRFRGSGSLLSPLLRGGDGQPHCVQLVVYSVYNSQCMSNSARLLRSSGCW